MSIPLIGKTVKFVFFNGGIDFWFTNDSNIRSSVHDNKDGKTINAEMSSGVRFTNSVKTWPRRNVTSFAEIHFNDNGKFLTPKTVTCGFNGNRAMATYIRYIYDKFYTDFKDSIICATEVNDYAIDNISGSARMKKVLTQQYYSNNAWLFESTNSIKNRCIISSNDNIKIPSELYNNLIVEANNNAKRNATRLSSVHVNVDIKLDDTVTTIPKLANDLLCVNSVCYGNIQFGEYYMGDNRSNPANKILLCNIHLRLKEGKTYDGSQDFINCLNYIKTNFFGTYRNIIIGGDFNMRTYSRDQKYSDLQQHIYEELPNFNSLNPDFFTRPSSSSMHVLYKLPDFDIKQLTLPPDWNERTFIANSHLPIHVELTQTTRSSPLTLSSVIIPKMPASPLTFDLIQEELKKYNSSTSLLLRQKYDEIVSTMSLNINKIKKKKEYRKIRLSLGKSFEEIKNDPPLPLAERLKLKVIYNLMSEKLKELINEILAVDEKSVASIGGYVYNKIKYNELIMGVGY